MSTKTAALLLLGLFASCKSFPASLYVDPVVLEELERSRFYPDARDTQISGHMGVHLDYDLGPWEGELQEDRYYRLPGPVEGILPKNFEPIETTWSAGLAEGDLVLAKSLKAQGLAMTMFFEDFCFFNHVGVLVKHQDRWHVCESWPEFDKWSTTRSFAARYSGEVMRVPLGEFLERYESVQIIRVASPEEGRVLAQVARESLAEPALFDPYHDPTNEELSCTEYVCELLDAAQLDSPGTVSITNNRFALRAAYSLGYERSYYLVPDEFARMDGAQHVAWISRFDRRADILIQRECYRTMHEEFQVDGRLGDYLKPSSFSLMGFRPTVEAFQRWALGYYRHNEMGDIRRVRRVLAQIYDFCFETKGLLSNRDRW